MEQLFVVVAYDVSSDKRRNRLANFLRDFGIRINYSVFECEIKKSDFHLFKKEVEKIINRKEDVVAFYRLCKRCRTRKCTSGQHPIGNPEIVHKGILSV